MPLHGSAAWSGTVTCTLDAVLTWKGCGVVRTRPVVQIKRYAYYEEITYTDGKAARNALQQQAGEENNRARVLPAVAKAALGAGIAMLPLVVARFAGAGARRALGGGGRRWPELPSGR